MSAGGFMAVKNLNKIAVESEVELSEHRPTQINHEIEGFRPQDRLFDVPAQLSALSAASAAYDAAENVISLEASGFG
jgi:hypothetical protein